MNGLNFSVDEMPLNLIDAIVLAIIQGITEWLPISSSAHLGLAQIFMNAQTPLIFDLLLHAGTLASAILYFRKEIAGMALALLKFDRKSEYFNLFSLIVLASIPTAIIGFAFHDYFASMFFSLFWIGITLMINAAFMQISSMDFGKGKEIIELKGKSGAIIAILMGIAQGISISPGISRSGATIGTAILMKVDRSKALTFSFLMSIPAIIGATIFEWKGAPVTGIGLDLIIVSIVVSGIVGYISIDFMMKYVRKKGLAPFAYYCWIVGTISLALSFMN
ncbi:MAG: undecaprenyl-diphosphate phosphatase [Candidatus Micrarchaeota archaeon]